MAHDVEEREDAGPGASDDGLAEDLEVTPAGGAGVGHGGHAGAQREVVGIDAVLARVGIAFAGAGENVHVDIDEPGVTYRPLTSTVLKAVAGSILGATAAILRSRMATIADRTDLVPGIDDVAPSQQEVILLAGHARCPQATARDSLQQFHVLPRDRLASLDAIDGRDAGPQAYMRPAGRRLSRFHPADDGMPMFGFC